MPDGTNDKPTDTPNDKQGIAAEALRQYIERIERLEEEKAALQADVKEVYAEAKAQGFETKIIRTIVRLRKKNRQEREEEQQLLDLYLAAIGEL